MKTRFVWKAYKNNKEKFTYVNILFPTPLFQYSSPWVPVHISPDCIIGGRLGCRLRECGRNEKSMPTSPNLLTPLIEVTRKKRSAASWHTYYHPKLPPGSLLGLMSRASLSIPWVTKSSVIFCSVKTTMYLNS